MKRCPKCNKAYSDIMDHCPDCNIPLPGNSSEASNASKDSKNFQSQQNGRSSNNSHSQPYSNGSSNNQFTHNQQTQSNQKSFCGNCGTPVGNGKFCPSCGSPINTHIGSQNTFNGNQNSTQKSESDQQKQSIKKTFCGNCGTQIENGDFCPNCGCSTSKPGSGVPASDFNMIKKPGSRKKISIAIGSGLAVVILAIVLFLLIPHTVDHSCDWCGRSPSVAYETSDGSTAYVCKKCSKECKWCGDRATKHYENLMGMIVFVCDDCYEKVVD